jgi:hypothetical protein
MLYGGGSYATLVRPETIQRFSGLAGVEVRSRDEVFSTFGKPLVLFAAYNLSLSGIPTYVGTNTIEGGVKFGKWNGNGVRLYAGYHHGFEVFGQYYDRYRTYWSLGFGFDVW